MSSDPSPSDSRRDADSYRLTTDEIERFHLQGYLVLEQLLSEAELADIDPWFDHFVQGQQPDMGKDLCDMSQPYGTPFEQFQLVNAMLPSTYRPELKNNIYQRVCQSVAAQLHREGTPVMDYDQFLAKRPRQTDAKFRMHQDLGYWPKTRRTWTATFSLALSDSNLENGCLVVVPGTNREARLRGHRPVEYRAMLSAQDGREQSHTLQMEESPTDVFTYLPVKRGDVTVHDERIVHGSKGNHSDAWRKTYVMAFRDAETVAEERAMGFTHSHNDDIKWDTFFS